MASHNPKHSETKRKPTGNPVGRPRGKKAALVVTSSSENDSDHEYDNIHKDDAPNMGHHLEQGELIDDSESEDEIQPQDNVSKVMRRSRSQIGRHIRLPKPRGLKIGLKRQYFRP